MKTYYLFSLSIFLMYSCTSPESSTDQRPNIILIMADDMGYSDIACYGGEISTPHLDQLAKNGLRFKQFYNGARCCPTRASLMTGLYPHQTGIGHMESDRGQDGYRGDLNQHCVTIAQVMGSAGYSTYMSGKWHVTKHMGQWSGNENTSKHNWPIQRGFDRFFGTILGAGSFYDPITLTSGNTPIEPETEDFYYTDAIGDSARKFIREHDKAQPFFMYVSFTAPHWPLHAFEEDIAKYQGAYDQGWDELRSTRIDRMQEMGIIQTNWGLSERDARVPAWEEAENKDWEARRMEVYAAQVEVMDRNIGKLVEQLKQEGKWENTLIFFLADNGGCAEELRDSWRGLFLTPYTRSGDTVFTGNQNRGMMPGPANTYQSYGRNWANASNTPFRLYKHYVHEGGISSPLIVHWPKGFDYKNEWRNQPSHLVDIMATCVELGEATYPETFNGSTIHPMQGVSLIPAINNKPLDREAIYWEHEGNRAMRMGKWKIVAKGRDSDWELYDMDADRTELNNLADEYPDLLEKMSGMWWKHAEEIGIIPWPD